MDYEAWLAEMSKKDSILITTWWRYFNTTEYQAYKHRSRLRSWLKNGKPVPPPHIVKQLNIRQFASKYSIKTFVETGTFRGDMVDAMCSVFDSIISIELNSELFNKAQKRFCNNKKVKLMLGDSAHLLADICKSLDTPTIFWLDGHYSGGETSKGSSNTPILQELEAIFENRIDHVILIDDAREFTGKNDYPSIDELCSFVKKLRPDYEFENEDDTIRVYMK